MQGCHIQCRPQRIFWDTVVRGLMCVFDSTLKLLVSTTGKLSIKWGKVTISENISLLSTDKSAEINDEYDDHCDKF